MRRSYRLLLWIAGLVLALPCVVALLAIGVANTDPGRRLIERATAWLSSDRVVVTGLSGRFPDELRLARAELRDSEGVWAIADDIALWWSPRGLAMQQLRISRLEVGRLQIIRAPQGRPESATSSGGRALWRCMDVGRFDIRRLDLGAAIAGGAASLTVRGSATELCGVHGAASLTAERLDGSGHYELSGRVDESRVVGRIAIAEPANGPLASLLHLPAIGALSVDASIDGPRTAEAAHLALVAGPLHATVEGTVDFGARAADLTIEAGSPAMAPRADLSWQSFALSGRWRGPLAQPEARAHAVIHGFQAGVLRFGSLTLEGGGDRGSLVLDAKIDELRIPGQLGTCWREPRSCCMRESTSPTPGAA